MQHKADLFFFRSVFTFSAKLQNVCALVTADRNFIFARFTQKEAVIYNFSLL